VVALLIFSIGGGLAIYQGIVHIRSPGDPTQPWLGFAVLAAAAFFESLSFRTAWKEFARVRKSDVPLLTAISRSKDPGLFSVLLEDGAALIGVIIAAIGLFLAAYLGLR
jgi:divalent metal cation (Fe/Co/Zn/Cd) transporter